MKTASRILSAAAIVATFGVSTTAMPSVAAANTITDAQTYDLTNGNRKPRGVTVFHGGQRFNVDFDIDGTEVFLTYDGDTTATIHGTGYDTYLNDFVDINFTYTGIEQDPTLGLVARGATGQGSIGDLTLEAAISGRNGYAFAANIGVDGTLKLDGWLSDGGDWHAFGQACATGGSATCSSSTSSSSSGGGSVPAPGGLALVLVGLAGLSRKFRNKNS